MVGLMRRQVEKIPKPLLLVGAKEEGKAANCVLSALEDRSRSLARFGHTYGWFDEQKQALNAASFWTRLAAAKRSNLYFWEILA
jgi:hypothetical protein